ncbi:putative cinnamyl alcohol dehydrogenase 1, partial [Drosera capensis]
RLASVDVDGTVTKGGFSNFIVVHQGIPDNYPLELAAPLLCAGLTVYEPMIRHKMNQPGKKLGLIGLGGLGHMTVKFGMNVTVLSTSTSKKDEALSLLGADRFVLLSDEQQMKDIDISLLCFEYLQDITRSLDFIVDTASQDHPLDPYLVLLKPTGIIVIVGAPRSMQFSPINIILGLNTITGSRVAGRRMTEEEIDYCAENGIYPIVEVITMQYVNEACERMINKDVRYRFVTDVENSLK